MDPYLDEGMGDVIVGYPFCKASYVEARRFDGIITIRNGDDSLTYQMVRSNPRFKHPTNEKCNMIPPLLKVSEQDKMNGISHSYKKLKGFYKGVLNLGSEFIRDVKVEEWLTCGHINVHEIEIPEIGLHGFLIFCIGHHWKEIDNVGDVSIIWKPATGVVVRRGGLGGAPWLGVGASGYRGDSWEPLPLVNGEGGWVVDAGDESVGVLGGSSLRLSCVVTVGLEGISGSGEFEGLYSGAFQLRKVFGIGRVRVVCMAPIGDDALWGRELFVVSVCGCEGSFVYAERRVVRELQFVDSLVFVHLIGLVGGDLWAKSLWLRGREGLSRWRSPDLSFVVGVCGIARLGFVCEVFCVGWDVVRG
ncbi:hypothetical protein Tco_0026121 [Tanacetum coccineum]